MTKIILLLLTPPLIIFYAIRDMAILLNHIDLTRGLTYLFLFTVLGISVSMNIDLWRDIHKHKQKNIEQNKEKLKLIKRIGGEKIYKWILK